MKKHYLVFFSLALIFGFVLGATINVYAQQTKAKEKITFLVIAEHKDIYYSMSSTERKKIDDANTQYIKKAKKAGAFLEHYNIPGLNRNVSIEQYENITELYNHFEEDPMYPYIKFEVYPLQKDDILPDGAEKTKSAAKMKFLVIAETKDIYFAMSSDERKKIDDACTEYIKKAIKAGVFLRFYGIPGWNRGVSIEQYDNITELYNLFEGNPRYPYIKFEIYPLIEITN